MGNGDGAGSLVSNLRGYTRPGFAPTPLGTRNLVGNDPDRDPTLNPPKSTKERVRRLAGRDWMALWSGRVGFSSIAEAWNRPVISPTRPSKREENGR